MLNYCMFGQWISIWFSLIMHLYRPVMTRSVSFKITEDMGRLFKSLHVVIYTDFMVLHQRAGNIVFIALCYDGVRSRYWYYIHSYYCHKYGQFPSKLPMMGTLWLASQDMMCIFVSLGLSLLFKFGITLLRTPHFLYWTVFWRDSPVL